jgi:hypothetical protein
MVSIVSSFSITIPMQMLIDEMRMVMERFNEMMMMKISG